jgi:drug/metabolite transporter (DMT)-like permease
MVASASPRRFAPALRASLVMMVEPVLDSLATWLVHGEVPHWLAGAGGLVILGTAAPGALRGSAGRAPTNP